MKSNKIILAAAAAGLLLIANYSGDGNSKAKHPAFTHPRGQTMDDQTEDALVDALFAHRGMNKENATMNDGSKMTEAVYQQLFADFNAAIAYYPDRPQKNLEKLRDDLVEYKDQLVAAPEGVGMGPISGFSGVY